MTLEFTVKCHYGRTDYYPSNPAARAVLVLKQRWNSNSCVSLKSEDLKILQSLGHDIKIVSQADTEFGKVGN